MIQFIRSFYNYCNLIYKVNNYYNYYGIHKEHNNGMIQDITNSITDCGSVAIKFCQWVTPKLELMHLGRNNKDESRPEWIDLLEDYYENCPNHCTDYTNSIYRTEFNEDLNDIYENIQIIGSGSIAQVYKAHNKKENREDVLKIVHPNVENEIKIFRKIISILLALPCVRRIYNRYFPFDIYGFIDQFMEQIDLITETNHNLYFYKKYRDNPFIVIPEIYKISKNVLIMSYEEGVSFNVNDLTEYHKDKLANIFHLFIKTNILFYNYNHGDMHTGNWKIRIDNEGNINKIIIYDFGFCWSMPDDKFNEIGDSFQEIFEHSNDKSRESSIESFSNILEYVILCNGVDHKEKINIFVSNRIDTIEPWKISPIKLFQCTVDFCIQESVLIDPLLIQCIIILIQAEKLFEEYNLMSSDDNIITDYEVFRDRYLNILTFCETYSIFDEFKEYIIIKLNELQIDVENIFDTIDISMVTEKLIPPIDTNNT